jgi:nitrate reductase gamma subunit
MVETLIAFVSGPLLRASLLLGAVGFARVALLALADLAAARRRAGDPVVAWPLVFRRMSAWTLSGRPFRRRDRFAFNAASVVFHAAVLLVPLFFLGHVALWERAFGIGLPALPDRAADILSIAAVGGLGWVMASRAAMAAPRQLSRAGDWGLPALALVAVLSGLLAAHPSWSPIAGRTMYLVHLLAGELIVAIAPFTKLQHMVLFWTAPVATELAWRFPRGAGERVRVQLGRGGQGI